MPITRHTIYRATCDVCGRTPRQADNEPELRRVLRMEGWTATWRVIECPSCREKEKKERTK